MLGSRATDLRSGLGGVGGRAVRSGDVLPIGSSSRDVASSGDLDIAPPGWIAPAATLRFVPYDDVDEGTIERFSATVFRVSQQSDRMGYRLDGELALDDRDLRRPSRPVVMGTIQLLPGAGPVLLMADAHPTGGYPVVGAVISSDLPVAGQLAPGDSLQFMPCTHQDALSALVERERSLPADRMRS